MACILSGLPKNMAKGERDSNESTSSEARVIVLCEDDRVEPDELTICSKICYGFGGAPYQMTGSAIGIFLQIFLLDVALVNPFYASVILFVGRAWDAFTDPLIGFLVSKSPRRKIGTLIPWIVVSTPFAATAYILLWSVPSSTMSLQAKIMWYLLWYCLFQTLLTCYHVPYSALTMFISSKQKERDSITAYRMMVEVLGTVIGAILQGQIASAFSKHTSIKCYKEGFNSSLSTSNPMVVVDPSSGITPAILEDLRIGYVVGAAATAGVFCLCAIVLCLGVKEKTSPYHASDDSKSMRSFFNGACMVLRHGPYVKLIIGFLFTSLAFQLVEGNFALFCTYSMDFGQDFQNIVVTILVMAALGIPFWQWFLGRFGKKTAMFVGMLWAIPFLVLIIIIPSNLTMLYFIAMSSGFSVSAAFLLPWSMLPDVVDDFILKYPEYMGHEAIFYSFYVFFLKFASGISLGISTLSLDFAGYKMGSCHQPESVAFTLKMLVSPVPIALILLGLLLFRLYPINEQRRREIVKGLEQLKIEKARMECEDVKNGIVQR
uniref:sodium-dependent lysophosphatidylcholine symporter 1 n=1 Tax=Myxine glutinosa TaxID=7769 RepID=UPI003590006C